MTHQPNCPAGKVHDYAGPTGECTCPATFHSGVVTVASGLTFEEEKQIEANFFEKHPKEPSLKFEEAEVGEWAAQIQNAAAAQFWKAVEKANNSPSMLVLEVIMVQNLEHMRQRAYEEGRNAKGSSWREGYQRGLEEGKQATYESIYSRDIEEELRQEGRQAMREELAEKVEALIQTERFAGAPNALNAVLNLLKDTGSSNK